MTTHKFDYTNYEGRRAIREVQVLDTYFGTFPPYHDDPQWLIRVWDLDKRAERVYAQSGVHSVDGVLTSSYVDDPTRCLLDSCGPSTPKCAMGVGCRSGVGIHDLVRRFSAALISKLEASERKRGWDGQWTKITEADVRYDMSVHLRKGDPVDIAAFAAFMWHHGYTTEGPEDHFKQRFDQAVNMIRALQAEGPFECKSLNNLNGGPQSCGWPTCGCDPYANQVVEALPEPNQVVKAERGQEL